MRKKSEVYNLIIMQNGIDNQKLVAIEELSELTKELTKGLRKDSHGSHMHLAEEIGDVEICLEQLKQYYKMEKEVAFFKKFKLERLDTFYIHVNDEVMQSDLFAFDKPGGAICSDKFYRQHQKILDDAFDVDPEVKKI